ncbi:MAG: hypothetical protein GX455_12325 [Phycisphaerae bacterium]|nr:hypothetical protein [Phycisphaerae bacterium]
MRPATKRYGIITAVYLAVCIAGMGLFYGLVLSPQNLRRTQLHSDLMDLTEQFDQAQEARTEQSRTRLQERLAAVQKTWQDFVVDPTRASTLAFQIGQMANDLKVAEFSAHRKEAQTQDEMESYKKIEETWLQIAFRGSFESFAQFLNRIERNQPSMFVEEFTLKKNQDPTVQPEMEVTLCYFTERDEPVETKKESKTPKTGVAKPVAQIE